MTSHWGSMLLTWVITADADLDRLSEVVVVSFSAVKLFPLPLPFPPRLIWKKVTTSTAPPPPHLRSRSCLHFLEGGILLHGRFLSSPPFIYDHQRCFRTTMNHVVSKHMKAYCVHSINNRFLPNNSLVSSATTCWFPAVLTLLCYEAHNVTQASRSSFGELDGGRGWILTSFFQV